MLLVGKFPLNTSRNWYPPIGNSGISAALCWPRAPHPFLPLAMKRTAHPGTNHKNPAAVVIPMADILGLPDIIFYGIVAAVVVVGIMIVARKKPKGTPISIQEPEPEHGGVDEDKHTDLSDLLEKPSDRVADKITELHEMETGTPVEELESGEMLPTPGGERSVEDILAGPIDAAPSIGEEEHTDVKKELKQIGMEHEAAEHAPGTDSRELHGRARRQRLKKAGKLPQREPRKKKDSGPATEADIDRYEQELTIARIPKPPHQEKPQGPGLFSGITGLFSGMKAEEEIATEPVPPARSMMGPSDASLKRLCMVEFDRGRSARHVIRDLQHKGMGGAEAEKLARKMHAIWIGKRKPLLDKLNKAKTADEKLAVANQLMDTEALFR